VRGRSREREYGAQEGLRGARCRAELLGRDSDTIGAVIKERALVAAPATEGANHENTQRAFPKPAMRIQQGTRVAMWTLQHCCFDARASGAVSPGLVEPVLGKGRVLKAAEIRWIFERGA